MKLNFKIQNGALGRRLVPQGEAPNHLKKGIALGSVIPGFNMAGVRLGKIVPVNPNSLGVQTGGPTNLYVNVNSLAQFLVAAQKGGVATKNDSKSLAEIKVEILKLNPSQIAALLEADFNPEASEVDDATEIGTDASGDDVANLGDLPEEPSEADNDKASVVGDTTEEADVNHEASEVADATETATDAGDDAANLGDVPVVPKKIKLKTEVHAQLKEASEKLAAEIDQIILNNTINHNLVDTDKFRGQKPVATTLNDEIQMGLPDSARAPLSEKAKELNAKVVAEAKAKAERAQKLATVAKVAAAATAVVGLGALAYINTPEGTYDAAANATQAVYDSLPAKEEVLASAQSGLDALQANLTNLAGKAQEAIQGLFASNEEEQCPLNGNATL